MKLTTILILLSFIQLSAGALAQKVSLSEKNTSVAKIFKKITVQTNYAFFVSGSTLKDTKPVTINIKNAELGKVLSVIFAGQPLDFTIKEKMVIVSPKDKPSTLMVIPNTVYGAQQSGLILGKVVDDKGAPLPGANIKIVELNNNIQSSVDGAYKFKVPPGSYTVEVSYISFQSKRIADVVVKQDLHTKLDIVLNPANNALSEVMVKSSFKKEAIAGLYATQKNAAGVTDGISAEQIARTPDNNMGQVLKRISGVTTVDNRFIVVRGLTERYNQGMIDGVILPSTDMNRRNFSFDVIPVEMVSNVIVNKTATPDVSSEFAGGQVSVNTLDIPLENFTIVASGSGFNSQTLGKDFFQAGKRGQYDFAAFDDGHRKLPIAVQNWVRNNNDPAPAFAGTQSQAFSSDVFKIYKSTGGANQNYRVSAGRVYELKNSQKWGFVAGLSLRNSQETNEYQDVRNMNTGDIGYALIDTAFGRRNGNIYRYNSAVGAQLNAGIQGKTYKIGLKNIYSQIFTNNFNTNEGSRQYVGPINEERTQANRQDPKITKVFQQKLEGEHSLTRSGLKLTWFAARTSVRQETRDNTKFVYNLTTTDEGVEYFQNPNVIRPGSNENDFDYRLFTDTKETDYNWGANLSQSFNFLGDKSLVKAGYNGIHKKRALDATQLYLWSDDRDFNSFNKTYGEILAPENVGIGKNQAFYLPANTNGRQFDGKANFSAGYLMLDQHFLDRIRIVYGMRVEQYKMENKQSDVYANETTRPVTGEDNTSYLPSVNLTYSITPKFNFRASFAKTFIRPDFRETGYFGFYDVDLNADIVGGDLVSTKIKNSDLRLEWYPSAGELVTVSAFHKKLDKPIELVAGLEGGTGRLLNYRLQNQRDAVNYGAEIEIRKSLGFIGDKQWLRNLTLFGNGALIKSKINTQYTLGDGTIVQEKESRALYGQSPYIINAGAMYATAGYGLTANYNRSGRRTYTIAQNPGYTEYENGRDQLDLQLFYRLLNKKMEVKLNVGNLLNTTSFFYINVHGYKTRAESGTGFEATGNGTDSYDKEFDDVRYRVKNGVTSNLMITYKF